MMQATNAAIIEPLYTNEAITDITSAEIMLSFQQTSILTALLPHIDTTPATLTNVQLQGPHGAQILSRVSGQDNASPCLYHFGSDSNFDSNGFRPSSDLKRHAARVQLRSKFRHLRPIEWTSDDTTMENSFGSRKRRVSGQEPLDNGDAHSGARNAKIVETAGSLVGPDLLNAQARNRGGCAWVPNAPARGRGRGCQSGSSTGEPFSEKRRRRIRNAAEKKRRNKMCIGFEGLYSLVPGLDDGGLSKSDALMKSAQFLDSLVNTNVELRKRLGYTVEGTD
jgi:hypothetical protein